jgi:brefeldin A-inhibited guanine nucleotide-exchange protein
VVILRFMVEVCWAPMLAAFSVPLDQSEDEVVIYQCLEGFHNEIHVTSVMCMQTQRDVFVTSLAKFTSLHSVADIKQKNIDAIKVSNSHLLVSPHLWKC